MRDELRLPTPPKREIQTVGFRPPPNRRSPERITIYGGEGVGKSSCWLDVAVMLHKTGADAVMYVIDTDNTWDVLYDMGYGYLEDEGYIVCHQPTDMEEAINVSLEVYEKARPVQDWIVIDMVDWFWEEAQNYYTRQVHGMRPSNYFLEMRAEVKEAKKNKKGHKAEFGGQEGTDWLFISKVYKDFEEIITEKSKAHKMIVTAAKKLDENRGASAAQMAMYKRAGFAAPAGQKGVGHRCNTLLMFSQRNNGQRQVTMIKDRGRQESIWPEVVGKNTLNIGEMPRGFAKSYLQEIAGWKKKHKEPTSRPSSSRDSERHRTSSSSSRRQDGSKTRTGGSRQKKKPSSGTSRSASRGSSRRPTKK